MGSFPSDEATERFPAAADGHDSVFARGAGSERAAAVSPDLQIAYLARHGQTESNVLERYGGRSPEPLTTTGRAQISGLAAQLALAGIGEIWTSEIVRARESAELVGVVLGKPVRVDQRLNEMRLGPWEGLSEQEVADRFPDAYARWCTVPDRVVIEGRETLDALAVRMAAVLADAVRQPRPVMLMTHVAPIRVAVLRALGLPLRLYKLLQVPNAACLALDPARRQVRRFGEETCIKNELSASGPASSVA